MSLINDALKRASQTQKQSPSDRGVMSGSPLQPVIGGRQRKKAFNPLLIVIPLVLLAGGGAAGWFFLSKRDKPSNATVPTASPAPAQNQATATSNGAADPKSSQPVTKVTQEPKSAPTAPSKQSETTKTVPPKVDLATSKKTETSSPLVTSKPPTPSSTKPAQSAATGTTTKETPTSAAKTEVAAAKEVAKPAATKPASSAAAKPFPPVKLQGIVYRLKNPSVLLNGKTLFLGEELDGVTVKKIERTSVTLEFSGQEQIFHLR